MAHPSPQRIPRSIAFPCAYRTSQKRPRYPDPNKESSGVAIARLVVGTSRGSSKFLGGLDRVHKVWNWWRQMFQSTNKPWICQYLCIMASSRNWTRDRIEYPRSHWLFSKGDFHTDCPLSIGSQETKSRSQRKRLEVWRTQAISRGKNWSKFLVVHRNSS